MNHLSQQELDKIREEEFYRHEIRNSLNTKSINRSRLLLVLNSPFFLWFMSSCLISLITWKYTEWKSHYDIQNKTNERINKIDDEITARLENSTYSIIANVLEKVTYKDSLKTNNPFKKLFDFPSSDEIYNPEFKDRNFISLLFELKGLVSNEQQKDKIENAIWESTGAKSLYYYKKELTNSDYLAFDSIAKVIMVCRWDRALNAREKINRILNE